MVVSWCAGGDDLCCTTHPPKKNSTNKTHTHTPPRHDDNNNNNNSCSFLFLLLLLQTKHGHPNLSPTPRRTGAAPTAAGNGTTLLLLLLLSLLIALLLVPNGLAVYDFYGGIILGMMMIIVIIIVAILMMMILVVVVVVVAMVILVIIMAMVVVRRRRRCCCCCCCWCCCWCWWCLCHRSGIVKDNTRLETIIININNIITNTRTKIVLDDPRMIQRLLQRHALPRLAPEQTPYEVLRLVTHVIPLLLGEAIPSPEDRSMSLLVRRAVEGGITAKQDVRDDARGPYVAGPVVAPPAQYLGSDVVRRAHDGLHGRISSSSVHVAVRRSVLARQAEVDDPDGRTLLASFE